MILIAFGELRDINSGEQFMFARFAKESGQTFDLPITDEQFALLAEGLGMVESTEAGAPAPTPPVAAQKSAPRPAARPTYRDEEDDEVEDLRVHRLAAAAVDDDL